MQSIRRFISNLAMRCEPFNHLLRKGIKFEWGPECQQSFNQNQEVSSQSSHPEAARIGKTSSVTHLSKSSRMRRILGAIQRRQPDRARHLLCE